MYLIDRTLGDAKLFGNLVLKHFPAKGTYLAHLIGRQCVVAISHAAIVGAVNKAVFLIA